MHMIHSAKEECLWKEMDAALFLLCSAENNEYKAIAHRPGTLRASELLGMAHPRGLGIYKKERYGHTHVPATVAVSAAVVVVPALPIVPPIVASVVATSVPAIVAITAVAVTIVAAIIAAIVPFSSCNQLTILDTAAHINNSGR